MMKITWTQHPSGMSPLQGWGVVEWAGVTYDAYFRFRNGLGSLELSPPGVSITDPAAEGCLYSERAWSIRPATGTAAPDVSADESILTALPAEAMVQELISTLRPFSEWERQSRVARLHEAIDSARSGTEATSQCPEQVELVVDATGQYVGRRVVSTLTPVRPSRSVRLQRGGSGGGMTVLSVGSR